MILFILLILGGLALLYLGAEALIRGAAGLGARMGISPIIVGLTVVSLGTSAPELVVCTLAAWEGSSDLAVGNVMGSNLANVGLILGLTAVIHPLQVAGPVLRRDIPWMLAVTVLAFPLMMNLVLGRWEGAVLWLVLTAYLVYLARAARSRGPELLKGTGVDPELILADDLVAKASVLPALALVLGGSAVLMAGGQAMVTGATGVAEILGISQLLIGLSVVAVGTSLPELAATLVAALRDEADLAVGNIVGSNIFNITLVLGGTALVRPAQIPDQVLRVEYPAVLMLSAVLLPLVLGQRRVGRGEGLLLLALYTAVWVWLAADGIAM